MSEDSHAKPTAGGPYGRRVADVLADGGCTPRLVHPHAVGEAGSVACGALVRVELRLEGDGIAEAACSAYGCPATLASARELAGRLKGASLLAAASVSARQISEALLLAPDKTGSAELAVDALHAALSCCGMRGAGSSVSL